MNAFKNTIISCKGCGKMVLVKPVDFSNGTITCSHPGCGYQNLLMTRFFYDHSVLNNLPGFGELIYCPDPTRRYALKAGRNNIGVADDCDVRLERFLHNGKCFISRYHCTLDVTFDVWTGQFRYQLRDGLPDGETTKASRNGTSLEGVRLRDSEVIDVPPGGIITLGGTDAFRLEAYLIPTQTLDAHRVEAAFDPDSTQ